MKESLLRTLVLGCVIALVAPSSVLGKDKGVGGGKHDGGMGAIEEALSKLQLTAQQKTKIEECKTKFRDCLSAYQEEAKQAKRSNDPEKKKEIAKSIAEKRREMMDGIRAVLTDEQKKTFDEAMPKRGAHGKGGAKADPKAGGSATQ
jgi:Spy/CpxP family protein refolding chaperone